MSKPVLIGKVLGSNEPDPEVESEIRVLWDQLAAALDDGRMSEPQFQYALDQEPDDDAPRLVRRFWRVKLRRWARDPRSVGADTEAVRAVYECGVCLDEGWVYLTDSTGAHVPGSLKPCGRCSPRQYELWRDHWRHPNHSCPECAPRRRGHNDPGRARQEAIDGARAESADADVRDLM